MVKLSWHIDAKNDLLQIYNYIYTDSIYYAVKTVNDIIQLVDNLKILPYMGRTIAEYNTNNKQELIYKSYRIMYKVESNKIEIHRIWHSARKLPKQLIS